MKSLRDIRPYVTISYSRPSITDLASQPCYALCEEAEATRCEFELLYSRMEFTRAPNGEWPHSKRELETMLEKAFDRGKAAQRKATSKILKDLIEV